MHCIYIIYSVCLQVCVILYSGLDMDSLSLLLFLTEIKFVVSSVRSRSRDKGSPARVNIFTLSPNTAMELESDPELLQVPYLVNPCGHE